MAGSKPLTIVGGGLAGLTLGIALRQQGVPVRLVEASVYPRHRVCGEFISGSGKRVLEDLGLLKSLQSAGMELARNAAFFSRAMPSPVRRLPEEAFCLSRFALDRLLARELVRLGGVVQENSRWREPFVAGVVRATGRRLKIMESGWRWFGLKIHARKVRLEADLEMHFTSRGYVGICRIEEGQVNICGLFRSRQTQPELGREWKQWLCGEAGSPLHARLADADFDEESFCSVAGLSLLPTRAGEQAECVIGDAISMIAPVTGNGMSMAFESAKLACDPLTAFCRGEVSWDEARGLVAAACDEQFKARLRWSRWLQRVIMEPGLCEPAIRIGARSEKVWDWLFRKTR